MPATLTSLRSGETFDLEVFPVQANGEPSFVDNEQFNLTGIQAITIDPDGVNERLVHGAAVYPGSNTIRFEGVDAFFDDVEQDFPAVVLDASSLTLKFGAPSAGFTYSVQAGVLVINIIETTALELDASLVAVDSRYVEEPRTMPNYTAGLTNIQWSTQNGGIVLFSGNPTQTGGTTTLLMFNDYGEDVILLSATNKSGQPITGQFPIRINGATVSIGGVFTLT